MEVQKYKSGKKLKKIDFFLNFLKKRLTLPFISDIMYRLSPEEVFFRRGERNILRLWSAESVLREED